MKIRKKLLSILLTAALVISLLPGLTLPALAASDAENYSFDIAEGGITISPGTTSGTLKVAYGASQTLDNIDSTQELTVIGSTSTSNTITVNGSISNAVNITLNSVVISAGGSAFSIGSGTTVNLTLSGTNRLSSGSSCAGLYVSFDAVLIITATSTGSRLTANGGYLGAGIGGGSHGSGGSVTITGNAYVEANGGIGGAGIGGGYNGSGGTVNISGSAYVMANSSDQGDSGGGAGIGGGGWGGAGGTVTINGGMVTAIGGAGIGGGGWGGAGNLYISGGSVNANFSGTAYQTSAETTAVYKTVVSVLPASTDMTCSINGGADSSRMTDASGYLYLWLPSGNAVVAANEGDNYYKAEGTIVTANSNTLTAAVVQKPCANGAYIVESDGDTAYTYSYTNDGIPTLTVNSGVTGFKYFAVNISDFKGHAGAETCVFVQIRNGQQITFCFLNADFDTVSTAGAGFNVRPGDVIEVYLVDSLSNSGGSPSIL